MVKTISNGETFGLIRPDIDAHTLGISTVGNLLKECGIKVIIGDAEVASAVAQISDTKNQAIFIRWILENRVTRIGFSYRLDPEDAFRGFSTLFQVLEGSKLFMEQGGPLRQLYFSGLPNAVAMVQKEFGTRVPVFVGDENQLETLQLLGVPLNAIPPAITQGSKYDETRIAFAENLIDSGIYKNYKSPKRFTYKNYGTSKDTLVERIKNNRAVKGPPLMRAHVGPYLPDYKEAKLEFNQWLRELAASGLLDIASVGSSQLSQSDFGRDWEDRPNGGGVPVNSEQDLIDIWKAARPMLVRIYAGTRNIPQLAGIYERTLNIAWHALSLWWFNKIDGRGPHKVKDNLEEHVETLKVIARTGKPFEPNIPHHFSFRGGDDYTYVLSSYLAAKTAKKMGIRYFVLQTMLNTPKYTWGIQDLAKARALLTLVRELEDDTFVVFLQPRAGLDYFSPNLDKAKVQLAAVSAMMDDIEPDNSNSPDVIHVVSYCEGVTLATPTYIDESIQITITAIEEYRKLKEAGHMDDMKNHPDVQERTRDLYKNVKSITGLIEKNIQDPYSAEGLYQIFKLGILTAPYLWEGREEFKDAVKWETNLVNGGIKVVGDDGRPVDPTERVRQIFFNRALSELKQQKGV